MKIPSTCKSLTDSLPRIGRNLVLLCTGSMVCAVAVNGILIPNQFVSGGFLGLALTIHYLLPGPSLGLLFLLLNLPLFVLSWRFVGRRFFLYSVAGMLIFSAAVQWIRVPVPLEDKLLGALLAGVINGLGSGIILRSQGSAGVRTSSRSSSCSASPSVSGPPSWPSTVWCWRERPSSSLWKGPFTPSSTFTSPPTW